MSSALTFSHPYQGLFADKYERNNKKGGVKAMKCFPTCTLINREHGRGTLCIDSVIASVDTAKVSSYFNYQPVDVIGVGRFVTDIDIMMNDKYFGDFIVYKEGEKYDQVTVTKLLRSKQFPFNPEIYAELDNQNNLTFSSRGWHYGWSGGRYKVHQPHRFEVIAFARPRSSPNSPYTCIGAIQGSNFGLFSSRRADPNDKLKRRVSRGLMALNAAERFASQKEEEILRKLETSSSTTPRNDSENDGDVDDALSFNQSPDFNSGNKSDDDDYDPFLKAGKRAAIQQYTKTVGNKAKKNKISGNNIPSYMQQRPDATFVPNVQYKAILPIASHGFGDRKVVKTEHHNPINYSFPSPMINPPSGDPATLAAMMVLQQNNNGAQNKAQDSFLGDIIMNPILSPQNPRTANNNNRMPNGNAQYLASPGFNFGMNASPSSINANMHNQAITFANDDMDQVDSLLNDLVSFEQAMGVEIESETPSETELNQPIAIPIIDAKREVNYSNKTVCKDEFCPSMQPPGMEIHSSPGAYSSDEFVSAESDEELFKDIDILQVLGSISSKLKISTEESVKPAIKDVTQAVDITSTSEKANAAELPAKKVTINENANIIIENNLSVSENLKKNEARLEKLQSLINDYAAWNFVKKRFAQMKINKVKIVKRKQVYFFPVPVTII